MGGPSPNREHCEPRDAASAGIGGLVLPRNPEGALHRRLERFQAAKGSSRTSTRRAPNNPFMCSLQPNSLKSRPHTTRLCFARCPVEDCSTAIRSRPAKRTNRTRLFDFLPAAWADLGPYALSPFFESRAGPTSQHATGPQHLQPHNVTLSSHIFFQAKINAERCFCSPSAE